MPETLEELENEYMEKARKLSALLDDLAWRKPDVEAEIKTLAYFKSEAGAQTKDVIESQEIVVRSAKSVLEGVIAEAEALDRVVSELQARIEKLAAQEDEARESETIDREAGAEKPREQEGRENDSDSQS